MNLLSFGVAVTFIGVAGAYVYLREKWLASHRAAREAARSSDQRQQSRRVVRDAA
jgi:hypothetical protein